MEKESSDVRRGLILDDDDIDEAALSQLEALELLGQISGRIGHDINNLVGAIQGCTEILDRRLTRAGQGEPHRKQFEIIQSALKKMTRMTLQLRSWARTGHLQRQEVSIAELLQAFYARLQEHQVQFDIVQCDVPPTTKLDIQLSSCAQMLCNIALDAADTHTKSDDRMLVLQVAKRSGSDRREYIDIVIADNRRTVDIHADENVFHPLRASLGVSNPNDHAFGVSLPMAWAVMHKHGGTVQLRLQPDVGAAVRFSFPAACLSG